MWSNKPSLKAVRRELTSLLPGRVTGKRQDERLSQERNSAPFSSEEAFPVRREAESPMVLTGIGKAAAWWVCRAGVDLGTFAAETTAITDTNPVCL